MYLYKFILINFPITYLNHIYIIILLLDLVKLNPLELDPIIQGPLSTVTSSSLGLPITDL